MPLPAACTRGLRGECRSNFLSLSTGVPRMLPLKPAKLLADKHDKLERHQQTHSVNKDETHFSLRHRFLLSERVIFIRGFIREFLTRLALFSPLRGRVPGAVLARCPSRGVSVTYCPCRTGLCAKITRASAVCGPSAASHRLTLAYSGLAHYRFSR